MALLTAQPVARRPDRPAGVRRVVARARSTPGRLTSLMVALLAIGLLTGVAGLVDSATRSSLIQGVRTTSGPVAVQAQELYRALSDADATAASAFLAGGVEPADLRNRYSSDIAAATAALAAAADSETDEPAVRQLSAQVPVYTGLIETARTFNRLGLPVGAAYLREASALMRDQLLPAAQRLYQSGTERLSADRGGAAGLPWLVLLLGLVTLAVLGWAQVRLSRQTRRTFNLGLVAASLVTVIMVLWIGLAWIAVAADLNASNRDGSAQVALLTNARTAVLQARADEALTLIARGNGAAFEKDFTAQITGLSGPNGNSGVLGRARSAATDDAVRRAVESAIAEVRNWRTVHQKLRGLDDGGNFSEAVKLALGTETDSSATTFNRLDGALGQAIQLASTAFGRRASAAANDIGGESAVLAVLTVLLLAGVAVGYQRRIAEYR
jgi:hypothetical protein